MLCVTLRVAKSSTSTHNVIPYSKSGQQHSPPPPTTPSPPLRLRTSTNTFTTNSSDFDLHFRKNNKTHCNARAKSVSTRTDFVSIDGQLKRKYDVQKIWSTNKNCCKLMVEGGGCEFTPPPAAKRGDAKLGTMRPRWRFVKDCRRQFCARASGQRRRIRVSACVRYQRACDDDGGGVAHPHSA